MSKMKGMKIYSMIALLGMVLMGCDKQAPAGFDEINGIYFNNRLANNVLVDSTNLTFVYTNSDEIEVPVVIQLLGRPLSQVRPIDIRIHSENAEEGVDYVLNTSAEMPADSTELNFLVTLKRTPKLKEQSREIALELRANDYFSLPLSWQVQAGGDTTSILCYRIVFSDRFMVAPEGWMSNFGGEFSQQKFELICRVLEIDPADFNVKNQISLAKWMYIQLEMTDYVKEQIAKRDAGEEYDEEAFDKKTGEPLKFTLK